MQLPIPQVQSIQAQLALLHSKRAKIMQGLKLLLPTITKTNGYTSTVEEVSFDVKGWRDKSAEQTPVIYIIDSLTKIVRHAGTVREYDWQIPVFGCYKAVDIITFEEFISDIEQCIYDNNTLFGQVNKMEVDQVLTDNQLFSELNESGTHLFEISLLVQFTRHARDSR